MAEEKVRRRRGLQSGMGGKQEVQIVGPTDLIAKGAQGLTLGEIETLIDQKVAMDRHIKRSILADLFVIYDDKKMRGQATKAHKGSFGLYIQKRFGQSLSTAYVDAQIIEFLSKAKAGKVLTHDKKDLIYILRKIAGLADVKQQKELLKRLDELDRKTLDQMLPLKEKGLRPHFEAVHHLSQTKIKLDMTHKQCVIKVKDPEKLRSVAHMVRMLNDDNLPDVIRFLEGS